MDSSRDAILITGAAGFIGAFLCKRLVEDGDFSVIGYDNLNGYYDVSLKHERLQMIRQADNHGCFTFVQADLCDLEQLERTFREYRPRVVVSLAAQAGVRYSIDHPREYAESNILGFFNVLEMCRQYGVEHFVFASSSSVYGDTESVPFDESAPCNEPISFYAATKKADELMAHSYAVIYGLPSTGLRFFTVYGPMGRPDMAYFSFAERMVSGAPIRLFNRGDMLRDFTYIDDVVEGIVRVIKQGFVPADGSADGDTPPARIFNIGHGDPVHLGEFVHTLEHSLRNHGLLHGDATYELAPMQAGDVHRTFASTAAFQEAYGYAPTTSIAEGLDAFASWFATRSPKAARS